MDEKRVGYFKAIITRVKRRAWELKRLVCNRETEQCEAQIKNPSHEAIGQRGKEIFVKRPNINTKVDSKKYPTGIGHKPNAAVISDGKNTKLTNHHLDHYTKHTNNNHLKTTRRNTPKAGTITRYNNFPVAHVRGSIHYGRSRMRRNIKNVTMRLINLSKHQQRGNPKTCNEVINPHLNDHKNYAR